MTARQTRMAGSAVGDGRGPGYVDSAGAETSVMQCRDIHVDARGFSYETVRFCDLNRIRDK
jgi:hypothetical protein